MLFRSEVTQAYPANPNGSPLGIAGLTAKRPGHFRGVATVVTKLIHLSYANKAFFGQKDAQQVVVVRRVAADLNLPVEIVMVPIVREESGLAMSSRNRYLSAEERAAALVLLSLYLLV